MRSLVVVEETSMVFHTKLLKFSISQLFEYDNLEVFLKDDCLRSCLIECQSFSDCKINIDPKYRVLMPFPCTVHVFRETWYREVNILRVSVTFISWINRQEEYRLSVAQILTSWYQSIVVNRMKIECASNVANVREYSSSNQHVVL